MAIEVEGVAAVKIQFSGSEPVLVENTGAGGPYGATDWPRRLVFEELARGATTSPLAPVPSRIELSAYGTYALRRLAEQILEAIGDDRPQAAAIGRQHGQ